MTAPLFDITRAEIKKVVTLFYARIRDHVVLAPIFAAHVDSWPDHEEKITNFWCNAILRDQSYNGNPMRTHMNTQEIKPMHFDIWIGLFDTVLEHHLSHEKAQAWSALVHRIGRSLQLGLMNRQIVQGAAPRLS